MATGTVVGRAAAEALSSFEQGRRDATIDAQLASHEKRLNAINGSIDRHAQNAGKLHASIEELRDDINRVAATIDKNSAIEQERNKQLKVANDKQISARTFVLGVLAILVPIVTLIITIIAQGH